MFGARPGQVGPATQAADQQRQSTLGALRSASPDTADDAHKQATAAAGLAAQLRKGLGRLASSKRSPLQVQLCLDADDQQVRLLGEEARLLEAERKKLEADNAAIKNLFRLRFAIYGHSDVDISQEKSAGAMRALYQNFVPNGNGILPFAQEIVNRLRSHFPAGLRGDAPGLVDAWIGGAQMLGTTDLAPAQPSSAPQGDAATSGGAGGEGAGGVPATPPERGLDYVPPKDVIAFVLSGFNVRPVFNDVPDYAHAVATFFRPFLHPFKANPSQPDGGRSLIVDFTPQRDLEKKEIAPPAPAGWPRSYVNLTLLGFGCRMGAIGASRTGGFKQTTTLVNLSDRAISIAGHRKPLKPSDFKGLAEVARYAATRDDMKDGEVIVFFPKVPLELRRSRISKLDTEFMVQWAERLADLAQAPAPPAPAPPPAAPASANKGKAPAKKPPPPPKRGPSALISARLAQLVLMLPATDATEADGRRAIDKLKADPFGSRRFIVMSAGARVGIQPGNYSGAELAKALDGVFKEFRKLVAAGVSNDPKRDDAARTIVIQPVFETEKASSWTAETTLFSPGHVIQLPAAGVPRTLEWWHYQSWATRSQSWEELVTELGFGRDALLGTPEPREQDGDEFNGRGFGYTAEELASPAGGEPNMVRPSNDWTAGW